MLLPAPDIPVGVELDPHCHISDKMMQHATIMILYKTMMHTDIESRAVELFSVIAEILEGNIKPTMALFDCRMLNSTGFDETIEPMKSFFEMVLEKEEENEIISISPVHGYPLANIPDMGSKMLVVTNNDPVLAEKIATDLGLKFFEVGRLLCPDDIGISLDKAQQKLQEGTRPVQLAELSDLSGCGFPTDGTELLIAMIQRDMTSTAVGFLWDPLAVGICHDVGAGVEVTMRIGGKASSLSGKPLDLEVVIESIHKQITILGWGGIRHQCDAAVVSSGKTDILLSFMSNCGSRSR